jgi:hypothetical protein
MTNVNNKHGTRFYAGMHKKVLCIDPIRSAIQRPGVRNILRFRCRSTGSNDARNTGTRRCWDIRCGSACHQPAHNRADQHRVNLPGPPVEAAPRLRLRTLTCPARTSRLPRPKWIRRIRLPPEPRSTGSWESMQSSSGSSICHGNERQE